MHTRGKWLVAMSLICSCTAIAGCSQGFAARSQSTKPLTASPGFAQVASDDPLPKPQSASRTENKRSAVAVSETRSLYIADCESDPPAAAKRTTNTAVRNIAPCPTHIQVAAQLTDAEMPPSPTLPEEPQDAAMSSENPDVLPPEPSPAASEPGAGAQPANASPASNGKAPAAASKSVEKPPAPEVVPRPQGVPAAAAPTEPPITRAVSTTGEPLVTLHVAQIDVRKALEMISRSAKLNILVSPSVSGEITLDLNEKTVSEALAAIAKMCNLEIRREKDMLYIFTPEEIQEYEENNLPVRVYHLNYVRSTDLQLMIKPLLSPKGQITSSPESEVGLGTDVVAGSASGSTPKAAGSQKDIKAGGNMLAGGETIIVQDFESILKKIDRIVAEVDVQPLQVLIDAVIVQVKLDKDMELGVNWAILDRPGNALGVVGNGSAINAATGFAPASVLSTVAPTVGKLANGFATNTSGIKFGWVGGDTTTFISTLETIGEVKILATPRLLVLNKQRAEIHVGDQLGYKTSTQTQTSTVEEVNYMNIGTQLRLRPFITSDGMIRMEVHPERSTGALDIEGIPQTNTQQVTTNVMVPNGATIVIGGLMDTQIEQKRAGVPLLCRLPYLGVLFGTSETSVAKRELVVILTPRIWRPECPEGLNYVGNSQTLGLDKRVAQRPRGESLDGPGLFQLTTPPQPAPPNAPQADMPQPGFMEVPMTDLRQNLEH